jgi:alpha-L-fucosidase
MRAAIDRMLSENLAAHRDARWQVTGNRTATLDVALGAPAAVGLVDLREDITRGQVIARYTIEGRTDGEWQTLAQGTTIGCRKLDRCEPVTSRHIRVTIADAVDVPRPIELGVYRRA